jgi:hypothetical protein
VRIEKDRRRDKFAPIARDGAVDGRDSLSVAREAGFSPEKQAYPAKRSGVQGRPLPSPWANREADACSSRV